MNTNYTQQYQDKSPLIKNASSKGNFFPKSPVFMHTELNKKEFEESKQKTMQSTLSRAEISFYYS